jgi:hypothetical protein
MDPVSNVDRLVLLLRQRLSERSATRRDGGASAKAAAKPASAVQALAAVEGLDERHLRRALIQNLLAESFDKALVNEAQFQQVVDRVTQTLEADVKTSSLLNRLVREMKEAAR